MDHSRALSQIAEIHQQIAKGEIYRGYRSVPIALSGVVGLAAAVAQPARINSDPVLFLEYWTAIAGLAGVIGLVEVIYNYAVRDHASGRRRTRQVLGQFLPAVLGGAVVTTAFAHIGTQLVPLLPGIWAICFGIGTFASRPYLPRFAGIVALYYCVAGSALLWTVDLGGPFSPWEVGGVFGIGQLMAAAVLYWQLERNHEELGAQAS
jgi:hypothetical protein